MDAIVAIRFCDKDTLEVFDVGQVYEGTPARVVYLAKRGFLKVVTQKTPEPEPEPVEPAATEEAAPERELGSMTNPELAELLRSMGVEVPKRANKAVLVKLVREARGE